MKSKKKSEIITVNKKSINIKWIFTKNNNITVKSKIVENTNGLSFKNFGTIDKEELSDLSKDLILLQGSVILLFEV